MWILLLQNSSEQFRAAHPMLRLRRHTVAVPQLYEIDAVKQSKMLFPVPEEHFHRKAFHGNSSKFERSSLLLSQPTIKTPRPHESTDYSDIIKQGCIS